MSDSGVLMSAGGVGRVVWRTPDTESALASRGVGDVTGHEVSGMMLPCCQEQAAVHGEP